MQTSHNTRDMPVLSQGEPSSEKLRELVLYIAWLSDDDPAFGATKLNKLLFFSDFEAFAQYGRAITWQQYECREYGPVPHDILKVKDELTSGEQPSLAIRPTDFFGHPQQRPVALRRPNLSLFSGEELGVVSAVIARWKGRTAAEISQASHEHPGWKYALGGETIPYEVSLLVERPLTNDDVRWGLSLEDVARKSLAGAA